MQQGKTGIRSDSLPRFSLRIFGTRQRRWEVTLARQSFAPLIVVIDAPVVDRSPVLFWRQFKRPSKVILRVLESRLPGQNLTHGVMREVVLWIPQRQETEIVQGLLQLAQLGADVAAQRDGIESLPDQDGLAEKLLRLLKLLPFRALQVRDRLCFEEVVVRRRMRRARRFAPKLLGQLLLSEGIQHARFEQHRP